MSLTHRRSQSTTGTQPLEVTIRNRAAELGIAIAAERLPDIVKGARQLGASVAKINDFLRSTNPPEA